MANNELLKLTSHQVRERNFKKTILAVGSCEAHGQHLAEGTDTLVSYMLACKVADRFDDMLVLPPITVGYSGHYDFFPFTLTMSYDTITAVIYDDLESCMRNGMNKIYIVNGHDGNIAPIEIASRKIKEKYPEARIVSMDRWWVAAGQLLPEGTFEVMNGEGHAGEGESSIVLPLSPVERAGAGQGLCAGQAAEVLRGQVGLLRAHQLRCHRRSHQGDRREGPHDDRSPGGLHGARDQGAGCHQLGLSHHGHLICMGCRERT